MPSSRFRPHVSLGSENKNVMQWNPALHIYRVNRFQKQFSLDEKIDRCRNLSNKVDFVEELLMRNMDHCAEYVISLLNFKDQLSCVLVSKLWRDFIEGSIFRRRVQDLLQVDQGLSSLVEQEGWRQEVDKPLEELRDLSVFKKILAKVILLKDVWRSREPKAKRLFCDSFVLSLKSDEDTLFCGLNSGCVQAWDMTYLGKTKEQECHDKGVKCIDVNSKVFITGSYDTTMKVWRRDSWSCVKILTLHNDSVWDLKMHGSTVATAGLDGSVLVYDFISDFDLNVRCYIQVNSDLVSAVDFGPEYLVTGHEDNFLGVWRLETGERVKTLTGHSGGVTGVSVQGTLAASSSYDATVRLWDLAEGVCLKELMEPIDFCRCIGFLGSRLVAGDFGGNVHLWDFVFVGEERKVKIVNHRSWECHKGHVVCVQLDACRIISGSRDRHVIVNDFWAKMMDAMSRRGNKPPVKMSRFLNRPLK